MSQQNDLVSALAVVIEQAQADFSQAQFNEDFPADTKWHYFMAGRILELLLEEGWVPREEREGLIEQLVKDLNGAHDEILRMQGAKADLCAKLDWPEWTPQANSIRWAERVLGKRLAKTEAWTEFPSTLQNSHSPI